MVVRGPDWEWGSQDGEWGPGRAGEMGLGWRWLWPRLSLRVGPLSPQEGKGSRVGWWTSVAGMWRQAGAWPASRGPMAPPMCTAWATRARWTSSVWQRQPVASTTRSTSQYSVRAAQPPSRPGLGDRERERCLSWACRLSPGKPAELQRRVSADSQTFQHGDKVKCLLDTDVLREMQDGHGGWNPRMAEVSCPARWPRARPPLHPLDPQPSCCARPQSPRPATVYRTDGHRAPHHRPWGRARAVQPRDPLDLPP